MTPVGTAKQPIAGLGARSLGALSPELTAGPQTAARRKRLVRQSMVEATTKKATVARLLSAWYARDLRPGAMECATPHTYWPNRLQLFTDR